MIKEELRNLKEEAKNAYYDAIKRVRDYEQLGKFRNITIDAIDLSLEEIRKANIKYIDGDIDREELNAIVFDNQLSFMRSMEENYLRLKGKIKNNEITEETEETEETK